MISVKHNTLNIEFTDYINFITKDGIAFTTRGQYHPKNKVRAVPCYRVHSEGERTSTLFPYRFKREVDEFGDSWLLEIKPHYVEDTNFGRVIMVPISDIAEVFDPFKFPKTKFEDLRNSKYGALINTLIDLGIPKSDIGVYGSRIMGFENENSDLDLVIRGKMNMILIKNNIYKVHTKLRSTDKLDKDKLEKTIRKYKSIYNPELNDFDNRMDNRWSTIKTTNFMLKIMFVPKRGDMIDNVPPSELDSECSVIGTVIDDENTCYMPRAFRIISEGKEYKVITYFYHFYYCVKNGDRVKINGTRSKDGNLILLHNRKSHGIRFENGTN